MQYKRSPGYPCKEGYATSMLIDISYISALSYAQAIKAKDMKLLLQQRVSLVHFQNISAIVRYVLY